MPEIRVILSGMPPMLRDILHHVLHEDSGIRIVAEVERTADAAAVGAGRGAHVVVTGEACAGDRVRCRLLVVRRRRGGSRDADVVELVEEEPLGDVSPGELVEAIRHAVAARSEENPWRHW